MPGLAAEPRVVVPRLIFPLAARTASGRIAVPRVMGRDRLPMLLDLWVRRAPALVAVPLARPFVVTKALPELVVRLAVGTTPGFVTGTLGLRLVAEALPPFIFRLAARTAARFVVVPLGLSVPLVAAGDRVPMLLRLAIEIGGPRGLGVVLVGGSDHGIEPFAD
jgi:hypothetical protein